MTLITARAMEIYSGVIAPIRRERKCASFLHDMYWLPKERQHGV